MPKLNLLVTFDLKDGEGLYNDAYKALIGIGLSRWSPHKDLRVPNSTVMGIDIEVPALPMDDLLAWVSKTIEDGCGKAPSHLAIAVLSGWGVLGPHGPADQREKLAFIVHRLTKTTSEGD